MNPLDARRRLLGRNVYKRTTEGNPAIAQGSLARRYPSITMQGWTEQAQYEGNQLLPLPVGKVIESESGNNTLTVTESGVNLNITESTTTAYTNDIYVFGNSQYNIEVGYEDASAYIPQGLYTLLNDTITNLEVFLSVWRNGVKIDLISSATTRPANFTIMDGDKIRLGIRPKGTLEINNMMLMVIKQTLPSTTPFEPYTGGQPSPNPDYPQPITNAGKYDEGTGKYQYEVKLTGANLFDISKVITNSGLLTNNSDGTLTATPGSGDSTVSGKALRTLRDYCPELISGKTYRLSANTTGTVKQIYLLGVNNIWAYGRTRTITDADLESEVFFYASGVNSEAVISDIMIAEVEDADYEPYRTPQTVTLTADRPLTKWDKLEKRSGQWGWVYKSDYIDDVTEVCRISGQGTFGNVDDYKTLAFYLYADGTNGSINLGIDNTLRGQMMCNHFRFGNVYNSSTPNVFYFNGDYISFRVNAELLPDWSLESPSSQPFVDWLNKKKDEGDPVIIWYPTTEETFVPLSESEQEQMNALYTFRPTTVLSNDCECNMSLTYKTKKSMGGG